MTMVDGTQLHHDAIEKINAYRQALQTIANLWPDPDCCAELVPEWVGPNDGRMRADTLWLFLSINTGGVPQTEEHVARARHLYEEALKGEQTNGTTF